MPPKGFAKSILMVDEPIKDYLKDRIQSEEMKVNTKIFERIYAPGKMN